MIGSNSESRFSKRSRGDRRLSIYSRPIRFDPTTFSRCVRNAKQNFSMTMLEENVSGEWLGEFGVEFGYDKLHELLSASSHVELAGAQYGLKRHESLAVYAYTLGFRDGPSPFGALNSFLRTGAPTGLLFVSLAADLSSALKKLSPTSGYFYRKTDITPAMEMMLQVNGSFTDPGFLSTSSDPDAFDGRDVFVVLGSTGVSIAPLSAFPAEDEVLFLPNVSFRVDRVERTDHGLMVEMIETANG